MCLPAARTANRSKEPGYQLSLTFCRFRLYPAATSTADRGSTAGSLSIAERTLPVFVDLLTMRDAGSF
jgi:hypothetical protein